MLIWVEGLLVVAGALVLLWLAGNYTFWRPVRPREWPRILMYHRVAPLAPSGMNVPPAKFERQLRYLKAQGFRSLTLGELADAADPAGCVVLTFDDGFADNDVWALPLLEKYGFKATIFIAPEIAQIDKLQPEQIRRMAASGRIEFGAHTLHHVNLNDCDDETATQEIRNSIAQVERLSGQTCRSFAYPFGRFGEQHVAMLKAAGIRQAVTVRKAIEPLGPERFRLPRVSVDGRANWVQFYLALSRGRFKL